MKRSLATLVLLLWPCQSWAHNLIVEATLHPDKVVVEAFYDDNIPAKSALVKIFLGEKLILEGKTDAKGFCTLPRPESGEYQILVNAGAGHRGTIELRVTATPSPQPPPRAEITGYPWLKVGVGLGGIGLLSLTFWAARRKRDVCTGEPGA